MFKTIHLVRALTRADASSAPRTTTPATTSTPTMISSVAPPVRDTEGREQPAMLILMEMINRSQIFYNRHSFSIYIYIYSFVSFSKFWKFKYILNAKFFIQLSEIQLNLKIANEIRAAKPST